MADPDDTKKTWDEFVRVLPKMWTQERFGHHGEAFSMPSRAILPKPYQKPHPPMWVAVTSPGTEIDAAERGLGSLGLTFGGFAEQEKKIAEYRRRIRVCEPVGEFINEQVNTVNFLFCHEDDATGVATGRRLQGTFGYLAGQLLSAREAYPTRSYPTMGLLPQLRPEADGPDSGPKVPEGLCVGNPARIIETIKGWESIGVDRVNFLLNAMETVPQQDVLDSMRLFAREVMPKFERTATVPTAAAAS
jgi:alkanesulfonate monooxygenase SsuD/methylene tetrahydromethanopterin reductase-like flavin-dependent oxidoreductase (luciferase family)